MPICLVHRNVGDLDQEEPRLRAPLRHIIGGSANPTIEHMTGSSEGGGRGERRRDAAQDLKVSLGDILQHLLLHCQLSHGATQLGVLLLQIFELARLFGLQRV
jgi:hypothetical protein